MTDALYEGSIRDFRIVDSSDDELTEGQKLPWNVKVVEGGYGGLHLTFTAPDGTSREVLVEIDRGNVKINTYSAVEADPDTIISITDRGTHVAGGHHGVQSAMYVGNDCYLAELEPHPGFVEMPEPATDGDDAPTTPRP